MYLYIILIGIEIILFMIYHDLYNCRLLLNEIHIQGLMHFNEIR